MHCCGRAVCYSDILGLLWMWVLTVHWKAERCLIVHMKKEAEESEAGRAAGNPQALAFCQKASDLCAIIPAHVCQKREQEKWSYVTPGSMFAMLMSEAVASGFVLTVFGRESQRLVL